MKSKASQQSTVYKHPRVNHGHIAKFPITAPKEWVLWAFADFPWIRLIFCIFNQSSSGWIWSDSGPISVLPKLAVGLVGYYGRSLHVPPTAARCHVSYAYVIIVIKRRRDIRHFAKALSGVKHATASSVITKNTRRLTSRSLRAAVSTPSTTRHDTTREDSSNMSAGKDTEESNGQASSPVMVSAALGDQFAQVRKSILAPIPSSYPSQNPTMPLIYGGLLPLLLLVEASPHLILSAPSRCLLVAALYHNNIPATQ